MCSLAFSKELGLGKAAEKGNSGLSTRAEPGGRGVSMNDSGEGVFAALVPWYRHSAWLAVVAQLALAESRTRNVKGHSRHWGLEAVCCFGGWAGMWCRRSPSERSWGSRQDLGALSWNVVLWSFNFSWQVGGSNYSAANRRLYRDCVENWCLRPRSSWDCVQ